MFFHGPTLLAFRRLSCRINLPDVFLLLRRQRVKFLFRDHSGLSALRDVVFWRFFASFSPPNAGRRRVLAIFRVIFSSQRQATLLPGMLTFDTAPSAIPILRALVFSVSVTFLAILKTPVLQTLRLSPCFRVFGKIRLHLSTRVEVCYTQSGKQNDRGEKTRQEDSERGEDGF